jgi:hypothetical protein
MAHTVAQRSAQKLCGARKKDGSLCRAFAGQGTDHSGWGRCRYHLGNSPSHNKHAAVAKAKQRIIESGIGTPIDITPGGALLMAVRLSAGHLAFIKAALEQENTAGFDRETMLSQYAAERDRLVRAAAAAHASGIAEQQIRIASEYGSQLAAVLRTIFEEIGLSPDQWARLPDVLRDHLGTLEHRHSALLEPPVVIE